VRLITENKILMDPVVCMDLLAESQDILAGCFKKYHSIDIVI